MTTKSSLRLKLIRHHHDSDCTGGILSGGGLVVPTLEGPWTDNDGPLSCIPLGTYRGVREIFGGDDDQWLIVGVPDRLAISIGVWSEVTDPITRVYMLPNCCIHGSNHVEAHNVPTKDIFGLITDELSGFTLEIVQHLPYTDYLSKHGYASPHKQE